MPELPEVETTRRGVLKHVKGREIVCVQVRQPQLRWKIDSNLQSRLKGLKVITVDRRGKYLLFRMPGLSLMIHLGMSGSLRMVPPDQEAGKHDHVDICFAASITDTHLIADTHSIENTMVMRYRDPRKFGSFHLLKNDSHPLLDKLGPEPLSEDFSADYLFERSRGRKRSIKSFIMDSHIVVGVGNIYACEALFLAAIRPGLAAGRISRNRCERLVRQIKQVLEHAIEQGGTTLKDFVSADGQPGYFKQRLFVYGRGGDTCLQCGSTLREIRQSGRSSVYCPECQT